MANPRVVANLPGGVSVLAPPAPPAFKVSQEEAQRLQALLGKKVANGAELVDLVGRMALLSVEGAEIKFEQRLLERLGSRARMMSRPLGQYISERILWHLNSEVGL